MSLSLATLDPLPSLTEGELDELLSITDEATSTKILIQKKEAELKMANVDLLEIQLVHSRLMKTLSKKYHVPLYDKEYSVDALSGEIKKGEAK